MNNSLATQVELLLFNNAISCDKEELSFQIESHPSYPSLHSITGVLDHFNIDNIALDVPINQETLSQLPNCFLAQIKDESGMSFVIVNNNNEVYNLISGDKKKQNVSSSEFLEKFTGIIVAVEKTEGIELKKNNTSKVNTILISLSLMLLAGLFIKVSSSLSTAVYFLLSAIGVYISRAIIKQELGEQSLLGDAFCSQSTNTGNSCNSVLSSKGAQFGRYKLSDFSMVYFIGLVLSTLLLTLIESSLTIVFVFSLIAIPITVYSIYYQYAVVKQWCFLCLSVTAVLWIQAALILSLNYNSIVLSNITLNALLVSSFSFLSVFTIWNILSPNIKLIKELKESKIKYFKFKRDYSLFEALLNKSTVVDTTITGASEVVFGNPEAPLNITLITSPFCGHCKPVHTLIEQVLKKHSEKVQIHIRFSAHQANTPLINITSRLLELYHTESKAKCLEAMHDIYGGLTSEQWFNKWGETNNKAPYLNTLKLASEWCKDKNINFTPEILINGRSFPKEYERSELIYFIEDLYENANLKQTNTLHKTV
ncbi:hypothetical protein D1817_14430 [Flavobacteriaceae bacterium]|nr:hypothetical protein D1817_14430 [Flavobacteriaceae bacterium]